MVNYDKNIINEFKLNLLKLEQTIDQQNNNFMSIDANITDEERQLILSIQNKYKITFFPDNLIEFLKDIEKCFSTFENLCYICALKSDDLDDSDNSYSTFDFFSNLKKKELITILNKLCDLLIFCFIIIFVLSIAYFRK